jgi:hypothetical protein
MTPLELALRNLAAWSLQVGVLALAAAALARLAPIERPAARLAFGQALLILVLGLPLVQPWDATVPGVTWSAASSAPSPPPPAASGALPSLAVPGWRSGRRPAVLGAAFRLSRIGVGLGQLRPRRRARPTHRRGFWSCATRSRRGPAFSSPTPSTPATFGLRRPIVLLPPRSSR